jgi:hypothetical protein
VSIFCRPTTTPSCAFGLRLLLEQQADFHVVGETDYESQAVDLAASHTLTCLSQFLPVPLG